MYLYVGEKNKSRGREIKIGIQKSEFDKKEKDRLKDDKGNYYTGNEVLEIIWDLLIISADQPQTPTEKENHYRKLEKTFEKQWPHREKFCRKYWENVAERMEEAINFFDTKEQGHNYQLAFDYIEYCSKIKKELEKNSNIKNCGCANCPHSLSKKNSPTSPKSPKTDGDKTGKPTNQLKEGEKKQILKYFKQKNIQQISILYGKLIIKYNDNTTKTIVNEDSKQKRYHQIIANLPNQTLALSDLEKNNTENSSSTSNSNKAGIYIGLIIGGIIIGGIIIYFLMRKKKKVANKL